jgi:hypothetical protein
VADVDLLREKTNGWLIQADKVSVGFIKKKRDRRVKRVFKLSKVAKCSISIARPTLSCVAVGH